MHAPRRSLLRNFVLPEKILLTFWMMKDIILIKLFLPFSHESPLPIFLNLSLHIFNENALNPVISLQVLSKKYSPHLSYTIHICSRHVLWPCSFLTVNAINAIMAAMQMFRFPKNLVKSSLRSLQTGLKSSYVLSSLSTQSLHKRDCKFSIYRFIIVNL